MFDNPYQPNYGNWTNPYFQPPQPPKQPPVNMLIKVSGPESARSFKMGPDSCAILFNDHKDEFYIVTTDGAGFANMRTFVFTPVEAAPAQGADYVSRSEFEELKRQIANMGSVTVPSEVQNA